MVQIDILNYTLSLKVLMPCKITYWIQNYTLCVNLYSVCKITYCVWNKSLMYKLHTVCKMTHYVWNNTLCTKLHMGPFCAICGKTLHSRHDYKSLTIITNWWHWQLQVKSICEISHSYMYVSSSDSRQEQPGLLWVLQPRLHNLVLFWSIMIIIGRYTKCSF